MIKRNSSKWVILLLIMSFMIAAAPVVPAQAASATISLSTQEEEIRVGDMVEVSLTIEADETIGDFEGYLKYDDSIFEFYSAASCITGGAGILRISDIGASPSAQERSYKIYFKAVEKGECKIELYNRPVVYGYMDGTEMSVTGYGKSFLVYPAYSASDDSTLSSLQLIDNRIETVVLTPAFQPEITEYYAAVPYETDSVIVSAIATDQLAAVSVTGAGAVAVGTNEICISVKAEDGSVTEYKVHMFRSEVSAPPQEEPTEPPVEQPEKILTPGVVLKQEESDILITEYHTYRVCEKPDSFQIPDGYVETSLWMNEIQITAYAKQEEPEAFLLLVLANEHGQIQWYRYDRVEQTIQRVNDDEIVITQVTISNEEEWQAVVQQYKIQQMGLGIAVALLAGICIFLLVIIVWLCIRDRRVKNER